MAQTPETLFELAQNLEDEGNLAEAAEAYRRALSLAPKTGEAHHNLARLLRRLEQTQESLRHARIAADLLPENPAARNSLGQSLEQAGLPDEAIGSYREALRGEPSYIPAAINIGRLLETLDRPDEAAAILAPLQKANPSNGALAINLANAYLGLGRPRDALTLLDGAIQSAAESALALNSLGTAHYILRNWPDAASAFRQAITLDPEFAQAHENLAQTLFQTGNFSDGWPQYEWRWKNPANALTKISFPAPEWDGAPLSGRTLLLHGEQGFGDTIQFMRLAEAIDKQGGKVVLACQQELVGLFQGACHLDGVTTLDGELPEHQLHAPLLNLPRILGLSGPWLPKHMPYLSATAHPVLADLTGQVESLRIGIAWSGRKRHHLDAFRNRSCRAQDFLRLADSPGVSMFSLQTGKPSEQLGEHRNSGELTDLSRYMTDFAESAALVQGMDLIVTVDTALAHLAGALGKPCCILLAYTSDWRWNEIDGRNPWYPSVISYRQPTPGNWEEAFAGLMSALKNGLRFNQDSHFKIT